MESKRCISKISKNKLSKLGVEQSISTEVKIFKRPWCKDYKIYHKGRCFRNLDVCYGCGRMGHYKKRCPKR